MTETMMVMLRITVLLVMAAAVIGKLRQRAGLLHFTEWVAALGLVPRAWSSGVARAVVCVEAATAVLVLLPWTVPVALALALAGLTFGTFTVATWRVVRRGTQARCYCFGPSSARLGLKHVARDGALALASGLGLAGSALPLPPPAGILLGAAAGALLALLAVRFDDITALFSL